jgi:hypothetical protein
MPVIPGWETGTEDLKPAQIKVSILYLKNNVELGMVAQICNPSYLGNRGQRITVQDQPGKK